MKGDFSRKTFAARKHYAGVLMQQGRVQLDADWNEQLAIQRHRTYTEAEDVIGPCGAPKRAAGFSIRPTSDGQDLILSPGRFYVHGRLCELESSPVPAVYHSATEIEASVWHVDGADFAPNQYVELSAGNAAKDFRVQAVDPATRRLTLGASAASFQGTAGLQVRRLTTYLTQPDLPDPPYASPSGPNQPPTLALPDGAYILYLDVWPRHLTAIDDEDLREKALGGPDTTSRIKTVWQLKLWPGPDDGAPLPGDTDCASATGWDELVATPTGRLSARTNPGPASDDPCVLPPGAGYLGLENQLYRVEIHEGGVLGTDPISFTWSRDNGSVVKQLAKIPNTTQYTVDTGPDDVLGLANGQWVEQVDDAVELNGIARDLFQLQIDPTTSAVTLSFAVNESRHPQLRRWDSPGQVDVPSPPVWLDLENGIQVRFGPGSYRRGDYWLIPARTVLGDIEWPRDAAGEPVAQPRRGVRHRYCRVGVLHVAGDSMQVDDCRTLFPPLAEVKTGYSCCTFTVGDGEKYVGDYALIQDAVDALPDDGGQICLYPGRYVENVRIDGRKRNVHIKGCGRRSRVVSEPPNADGVAAPVFHLVGTERVKIESLTIQAAPTAPGILASEQPSRGIVIERVSIEASGDSAIKIRGAEDVRIERCRISMTHGNGGWPGIFLQAVEGSVRRTVVRGTLLDMSPPVILRLAGSLAVSALQLGGGSERIRVLDNLFQGCSGQGITLGSHVEVGADGRPIAPERGGGWVADRYDPCFPCEDPTTGDRPPREGGEEPPTRLQSEGDLYDIDIRRNRILDMGLDGIGVAHFFDLERRRQLTGPVRVEDLAIVENRIERCVRRAFAPIPPNMTDLMAYGGIALSLVEGLLIRDNRIEDLGFGGVLPTCGVFVLYAEGAEIGRNHVLNGGGERLSPEGAALPGRQGGIHLVYVRSLEAGGGAAALAAAAGAPSGPRRLAVALVLEANSVDVVRGQALSVGAFGPVSVVSNRLISRGLVSQRQPASEQPAGTPAIANVLTRAASLAAIVNLGSAGAGASAGVVNLNTAATHTHAVKFAAAEVPASSGHVLFDDNQCLLDLSRERSMPALLRPSIVVMSLDDVGFQDNQTECVFREGLLPVATLIVGLWSQRTISNRFRETRRRAWFSAMTMALMNMTAHNQADHCLWVLGPWLSQAQPNHVLADVLFRDHCPLAQRSLADLLAGAIG